MIAEGIETVEERDTLVSLGGDLCQGYLFAAARAARLPADATNSRNDGAGPRPMRIRLDARRHVTVELTKEYRFEAAHRLPRVPEGHKCARAARAQLQGRARGARARRSRDRLALRLRASSTTPGRPLHARFDHRNLNDVPGLENSTSREPGDLHLERAAADRCPQLSAVTVWETATASARTAGHDASRANDSAHLRFMTLNLWGENGPWEARLDLVGPQAGQPAARRRRAAGGARGAGPDRQPGGDARAASAATSHVFAPATAWGGGHEGLAILSRFPIGAHDVRRAAAQRRRRRGASCCRRASTATSARSGSTPRTSATARTRGGKREDQVHGRRRGRRGAHKSDNPQVLMGDFNAVPHSDEIRWLCGLTTLGGRRVYYQDAWDMLHPNEPGYTWARDNHSPRRMCWLRGDRRLDYIFVTPPRRDGRGTVHDVAAASRRADGAARRRAPVRVGPLRGGGGDPVRARPRREASTVSHVSPRARHRSALPRLRGARAGRARRQARHRPGQPGGQPRAQAQDGAAGGAGRGPARAGGRPRGADRRSVEHVARGRVARGAALARAARARRRAR